jgi:hypothetical protein
MTVLALSLEDQCNEQRDENDGEYRGSYPLDDVEPRGDIDDARGCGASALEFVELLGNRDGVVGGAKLGEGAHDARREQNSQGRDTNSQRCLAQASAQQGHGRDQQKCGRKLRNDDVQSGFVPEVEQVAFSHETSIRATFRLEP